MIWWCRTTALPLCIPPFIPSGRQTALGDTSCWFTSGLKRRAAAAAGASAHLAPLSSKHVNHNRKCQCHHSWAYSVHPLQPEHMRNQILWVKMYKIKINESNQSWTVCSCIAFAPMGQPWKCEIITFNFKNDCKLLHWEGHTNWNLTFYALIDKLSIITFFFFLQSFWHFFKSKFSIFSTELLIWNTRVQIILDKDMFWEANNTF